MVLSSQPAIIWIWYFWQFFPKLTLTFLIIFPLIFLFAIIILILSAAIVARIFLSIISIFHKPKEGVFNRSKSDKSYCIWSLRGVIRKWPIWLARQLNLPAFEKLTLKILGVKAARANALYGGWVDCEFIEFGKNVRVGQGSVVMSNTIIKDKLIIKKTVIKDNVVIGPHSVIMPGTVIGANTVVDAITLTKINQNLEPNSIYSGIPAKKVMDNKKIDQEEKRLLEIEIFEKSAEKEYDESNLRAESKEISVPYEFYVGAGWIIIGCSFILPAVFFIIFIYGNLIPNILIKPLTFELLLDLNTIVTLLLTPLILIGIYLFHLFFVALITRWFYTYVDKRGPLEGVFDRSLDKTSHALDYYHARSFLLKYPVFAVMRSPFPWLINWELRFIGSNRIGKGTTLEEGVYIHSHIHYGKDCYVGTFAHNTNHLVDGVYGNENLTFYGAQVGNNCVFTALTGGLPGLEIGDDTTMLPMGSTVKFDKLGNDGVYFGFPAKKLTKEQINDILGGIYDGE
jgi:acetyltransferase-like isoleucine patch superfamily enzyme